MTRSLYFTLFAGFLFAACDTAPPEVPPSAEVPCAAVTADGAWEALSPPDLLASRIRLHGDYLFAVSAYEQEGLWRRDLTSGQPPDTPWEALGLGLGSPLGTETALDILADPADPDRLLAAISPGGFPGEDSPSVLRSTDGGQTWEDVSDGGEFIVQSDFRVAMRRLLGEGDGEELGSVLALGSGYAFRTQDYGETWEAVVDSASATGPVNLYPFDAAERHPAFPDVLWTGFQTNTFQAIITRSGDGAETWANSYTCPPACTDAYPADFGFDAGDERTAYVALAGGLLKTEDFGATWRNVDSFIGDAYALVGDPEQTGWLWVGAHVRSVDPLRLYVTEDGGETWTEIEVPASIVDEEATVQDFEWEAEEKAILVGTTRGVYRYRPGRTTGLECE